MFEKKQDKENGKNQSILGYISSIYAQLFGNYRIGLVLGPYDPRYIYSKLKSLYYKALRPLFLIKKRIVKIFEKQFDKYYTLPAETRRSVKCETQELGIHTTAIEKGKAIENASQAALRRIKIFSILLKYLKAYSPITSIYNRSLHSKRIFILVLTWCCLYSLQFAGDSGFLDFLCSYKNFIFVGIAKFLYITVFADYAIWRIPFLWIGIWLISVFFQWIQDSTYRPNNQLVMARLQKSANADATTNTAVTQVFEFGFFLLSFIALLVNTKNSTITMPFYDQTSTQLFHFSPMKATTIGVITIFLYICYIIHTLAVREINKEYKNTSMAIVFFLFTILFLTMLIILHTSSLILIIMGLDTLALIILYFIHLTIHKKEEAKNTVKLALQFFMAQALASLLYIYGMSWLSIGYNTLTSLSATYFHKFFTNNIGDITWCVNGFTYLLLGLIMKIGVGPMGLWVFSLIKKLTYSTILTYFTLIKTIYFLTLINIIQQFLAFYWETGLFFQSNIKFALIFIGTGLLSLLIGTFGLFITNSLKTFIASSSFVNFGLILPSFYFGGQVNMAFGFSLPYILLYSFTTAGLIISLAYYCNLQNDSITNLRGLFYRSKITGTVQVILLASLAGLPPFGGFFTKYYILRELYYKSELIGIVLIIISIIAAIGYARLITLTFIPTNKPIESEKAILISPSEIDANIDTFLQKMTKIIMSTTIIITLIFGIILFYYHNELCNMTFYFSSPLVEHYILPQRDWLPIFEQLSIMDETTKNHAMWQYFNTVGKAKEKLFIYLTTK